LLRFTHQGQCIALKGTKDSVSKCPKLKLRKLKGMVRKGGIAQMVHLCPILQDTPPQPPAKEIQDLIDAKAHLFKEPDSLPPSREFDHNIPLIPRVKPVNMKPYRYSPT
jgi:hypothetical protein